MGAHKQLPDRSWLPLLGHSNDTLPIWRHLAHLASREVGSDLGRPSLGQLIEMVAAEDPADDFNAFANHRSSEREKCAEIGHRAGYR